MCSQAPSPLPLTLLSFVHRTDHDWTVYVLIYYLEASLEHTPQGGSGFGQLLEHARTDPSLLHALPLSPEDRESSWPCLLASVLAPSLGSHILKPK